MNARCNNGLDLAAAISYRNLLSGILQSAKGVLPEEQKAELNLDSLDLLIREAALHDAWLSAHLEKCSECQERIAREFADRSWQRF
jgi:hypothetical protein